MKPYEQTHAEHSTQSKRYINGEWSAGVKNAKHAEAASWLLRLSIQAAYAQQDGNNTE